MVFSRLGDRGSLTVTETNLLYLSNEFRIFTFQPKDIVRMHARVSLRITPTMGDGWKWDVLGTWKQN